MTATESAVASARHVIDFDHHSSEFRDHCPEVVAELHASGCPLGYSNAHGGYWAIYGYAAVYDAVQNWQLFSSAHSQEEPKGVPPTTSPDPLIPIDVDGPRVQDFRRVVLGYMSPTGAKELEPRIREIVTELIDEFIEAGHADLSRDLFTPLPARLILEILGWEVDRWKEWIEWFHSIVHDRTEFPEKAADAMANIYTNVTKEIEARRGHPTNDLFSEILEARIDGEPFTDAQLIGYANLLLLGGMDTSAGLLGNVALYLDRDLELRQRLIDDPSLMPKATEEFLRHDSPAYGLYRRVTRDEVFHGQQLRKGDRAILMFPAAGLDPAKYDRPTEVDIDRTSNRHMAFGLGPHRCLGSHHARLIFEVSVGEVLRRLPDYKVTGEVLRFKDAGEVYALRSMPVSFTPGPRSTAG